MADRIIDMRDALYDGLVANNTPGDWNHIKKQIGMFSFTGLTTPQTVALAQKAHIYVRSPASALWLPGRRTTRLTPLALSDPFLLR